MRVLLAVDGSRESGRAAAWVREVLGRLEGRVTVRVLHVLEPPGQRLAMLAADPSFVGLWEEWRPQMEAEADALLEDHRRALEPAGFAVEVFREYGRPEEVIVRAAGECDLVVLGSRGLGLWQGTLVGSVSDRVMHRSPCPVVIVRGGAGGDGRPGRPFSLTLAVDGSEGSRKAAAWVKDFLGRWQGGPVRLTLVHAIEPIPLQSLDSPYAREWIVERVETLSRELLEECRRFLEAPGIEPQAVLARGPAVDEILRCARRQDADLVVVGSGGLTHWQGLVLGSVSDRVVHGADRPVLVVR